MLTFMAAWNDFFWPIIALDSTNPTVQVALNNLGGGYVPDQSIILAGTLVGTLPVIVVFVLLGPPGRQRHHRRRGEGVTAADGRSTYRRRARHDAPARPTKR